MKKPPQNYSKEVAPEQWISLLQQHINMKQEEIKDMEDNKKQHNTDGGSFDADDFFALAVKRSYGE